MTAITSLTQRLSEYVAAAFTGIWIRSFEHEDALTEIAALCRQRDWSLAVWDIDRGLRVGGQPAPAEAGSDPLAAIRALAAIDSGDGAALLVLPNFHRFLASAELIQAIAHQVHDGKQTRAFVVILAPLVQIPQELERHFVVIEHDLPDRMQLQQIAAGVATEPGEMPQGDELDRLLDAAAGLSRFEAEGAFSLALVRSGRLHSEAVWELKTQAIKKSGLLSLHRGGQRFADIGGLDALKSFCVKALGTRGNGGCDGDGNGGGVAQTGGRETQEGRRHDRHQVRPRGILLLGVPGTGKSAFCRALGNETGRPTLILDVGALMGSLVGATEANIRQALRLAEAMAPCVLFVDELEKALAGGTSGGQTDSGVTARLFGTLLTWLSDHESDVFVVSTSNDISRMPPEFTRAERFDGVFFLDLPGESHRRQIWDIYLERFGLGDQAESLPDDSDWTGAEIRSCCRLARLLDVSLAQAARNVVPVAVTAGDAVADLRTWAAGRCLSADGGGIYTRPTRQQSQPRKRRHISRDTCSN